MRHGKKFNHLGRPASHRKALLANQAKSLIIHKRIMTTVAKAKSLKKFIEPIITKSKQNSTHARRVVFSYFQEKEPVKIIFNEIADKVANRLGGYTRIIRVGNRLGDNAEMCMMELVDYNELLQKEAKPKKVRTRRSMGKANSDKNRALIVAAQEDATHKEPKTINKANPVIEGANEPSEDSDRGQEIGSATKTQEQ
ncbi:MAG: 50S ribosomal protein L17 [Bacteroidota bacterium]